MLKIKDNVDLKELEKYGFKYFKNGKYEIYEIEDWNSWLGVETKNRILQIGVGDYIDIKDDIIYDLIANNLVEKVKNE